MRLLIAPVLALFMLVSCGGEATSSNKTDTLKVSASITPNPPKVGQNALAITVTTADGAVVDGATIAVDPQMPMHGHGSGEKIKVTEKGKGVYEATPMTLQMPGKWEISIDVSKGEQTGKALLKFDVR